MLDRLLRRHRMLLVMLILAGIGWLLESQLDLLERLHAVTRLEIDGRIPGALLVLLGASLDTYRAHRRAARERERLRAVIAMARAAVRESHDPLTVIIANLEAVIDMHPGHYAWDRMVEMREAAWTIARRLEGLTEVRDAEDVGAVAAASRPQLFDLTR